MFKLILNEIDKKWLYANYPALSLEIADDGIFRITGDLILHMVFYKNRKPYVINPTLEHLVDGERIRDKYKIEIVFENSDHSNLPQVYEKGDRIKSIAAKKCLQIKDLHFNPNNAACLCIKEEEKDILPNGFILSDFFNYLVIPFFYEQSYFEKNNSWPWGEYSHGVWGLLEWYSEKLNITEEESKNFIDKLKKCQEWLIVQALMMKKGNIKGHHPCICGSTKKYRHCHKKVFHGLKKLKQDIINFNIKIDYQYPHLRPSMGLPSYKNFLRIL